MCHVELKNLIKRTVTLIVWVSLLSPLVSQAQDSIGRVITTTGDVVAVAADGTERNLRRGSDVFLNEVITTSGNGSTQLRLNDGAMIALEGNSRFTVDEFDYDGEGGASDTVIMSMVEGSLRTVTGVIGDATGDTYQMNMPFASIGVRGTEYALVIDNTGRAWVAVFDGGVSLAPLGGGAPVFLGIGGDTDFAEVPDDSTITALQQADPALANVMGLTIVPISEAALINLANPDDANQDGPNNQPDAAGVFIDVDGNVLNVVDQETLQQVQNTLREQFPELLAPDPASPN